MKNIVYAPRTNATLTTEIENFLKQMNQSDDVKKFSESEWVWNDKANIPEFFSAENVVLVHDAETEQMLPTLSGMNFVFESLNNALTGSGEVGESLLSQLESFGYKKKTVFYVFDDVRGLPLNELQQQFANFVPINGGLRNLANEILLSVKEEVEAEDGEDLL